MDDADDLKLGMAVFEGLINDTLPRLSMNSPVIQFIFAKKMHIIHCKCSFSYETDPNVKRLFGHNCGYW